MLNPGQAAAIVMSLLSGYTERLPLEAKQRYLSKLQLIGGIDPFCIYAKDYPQAVPPPVDASDLCHTLCCKLAISLQSNSKRINLWKHTTNSPVVGSTVVGSRMYKLGTSEIKL